MSTNVSEFLAGFGIKNRSLSHAGDNSTSVCVVALPSNVDSIRLVGPEEKHATVLFFGDMTTLPEDAKENLIQVLTLASSMFPQFVEPIREITRLGNEIPPALVAKLRGRSLSRIHEVLQIVPDIDAYLGNASQYPSYTPHVTLGYPGFEDEPALREKVAAISSISFDRLALWWGNERYEFKLNSFNSGESDGPMAHSGVKGMKWGVRKDASGGGGISGALAARRTAKAEAVKAKAMKQDKVGSSMTSRNKASGEVETHVKQADGSWKKKEVHPDVQALNNVQHKPANELSNHELALAIQRQRMIQEYQKVFAPPPKAEVKSDLERKIDQLSLQKKYKDLQRDLTKDRKTASQKFIKTASSGFTAFKAIDKALGGNLSNGVSLKLGIAPKQSPLEKLKASNEALKADRDNKKLTKEISGLNKDLAKLDNAFRKEAEAAEKEAKKRRALDPGAFPPGIGL